MPTGQPLPGRSHGESGTVTLEDLLEPVWLYTDPIEEVRAGFDVHALLEEDARKAVKETFDRFEAADVPYTLKAALGDPVTEILAVAEKENADLIVIGSRGLGAIRGAMMGSVSQKVVQTAKCPVMIVK